MGMVYGWAGSASYPRFDEELCAVAEVFGGIKTEHLKKRKETESERPCGYWFGFLSSDRSNEQKFIFPEGTNGTLVKWFNNIYYDNFTREETKTIWGCILKHPEIKQISDQIWYELKMRVKYNEAWYIF